MSNGHGPETLPVSSGQRRLWFLEQIEGNTTAWNVQVVFDLTGPLDAGLLERCLGELFERHEAIRTTFGAGQDGEPEQLIWPYSEFRLPLADFSQAGTAQALEEATAWERSHWRQQFDVVKGPLVRLALIRLEPERHHLVIAVHHLVADAWSLRNLHAELCALYSARAAGQDGPALPELPIQFGDFAVWEHDLVTSAALDPALAVWRARLDNVPAPSVFPADRPRIADGTERGETSLINLPAELVARLRALAERHRASLFMVLLSAFYVLLMRTSGEEDLVVGSGFTGRVHPDTVGLVGCFVNPVVLRTDASGGPSFAELLKRASVCVLEAFENQHVPFDRLVEELKPARSATKLPFFQTLIQFTEISLERARIGDADIELLGISSEAPSMDLALTLFEQDGLTAAWEYNAELFDLATIERLQRHFLNLLESAADDPGTPVWAMRMLDQEEERALLADGRPGDSAPVPLLHRVVQAHAAASPSAPAVLAGTGTLSYAELNSRANRLARALAGQGIGPESVVAVQLRRTPELPLLLLAILKAGGCYVPLDPDYPAQRLAFMVRDCGAALVVTDGSAGVEVPVPVISVARLEELGSECSEDNLPGPDQPDGAAYVIYTSGSTGQPKGVQITSGGLAHVARCQRELFRLTPDDRVGQFFSPSFDASVFEIAMALGAGAALVVSDAEAVLPGGRLADTLREQAVTAITMTPSALLALGEAEIATLRVVCAAGEACSLAALRPWLRQARCFNLYGPTEATIWTTSYEVPGDEQIPDSALPIGTAVPGVSTYVLDKHLNPVPELATGELYIAGTGLARGYLARPGLTAERFLPAIAGQEPGARMYRTGDLVRRRASGNLEFLGRSDAQVKIRGHRVELGEVEEVARACPAVRRCAAVAQPADDGANRLVCYVVATDSAEPDLAARVRAYVAERLPGYLVPDTVVLLDELPTLASGKIDRKALASAGDDAILTSPYAAPRTPMEEFLAVVWQELLKVERVGVDDDFFALGGHSLAATLVGTRLKAELSLEVPVTLIFEHRKLGDYTTAVLEYAAQTDAEFSGAQP